MGASYSGDGGKQGEADIKELVSSGKNDIVVFSSTTCGYCATSISMLQKEGFSERMLVVNASSSQRKALRGLTGVTSVPSIWLKGVYIGGCNDGPLPWHGLVPLLRSGNFQKILNGENPYQDK